MKSRAVRFKLSRRGYDVDEVESYIATERARAEDVQLAQRERIAALKEQCAKQEEQLNELKGREEQIKQALITATRNADRLTEDVKARYAIELDRLRLFRAKWTGAYEQLKERYRFDKDALNMESVAVSVEMELGKLLSQDFSLAKGDDVDEMEEYFKSEVDRLTSSTRAPSPTDAPEAAELREKLKAAGSSAAFSFEEALHPKESLAEICRALGLKALD